jgi:endo-1,4-beta-xylanase
VQTRRLILFGMLCGFLMMFVTAIVLKAQLRAGADRRGISIGAAVAMTPFRGEAIYQETLRREFNMIVAENAMKWDALRPSRATFNFTDADALRNFALTNNMTMRGHTLVWHSQIASWLLNGNFSREETIAILQDHISTVVTRYRGVVTQWDVVNEPFEENGTMRNSFWMQRIGPDYIRLAFEFARQADPTAKLYINDFNTEGTSAKANAMFNLVRDLRAQGVPIDGVGIQMHLISPFTVQQQHRDNIQRLAGLGVDIAFTEADLRIALPTTATKLQQQATGYGQLLQLCLSQPRCRAFVTWGFTDKFSWVPSTFSGQGDALIFDANYQIKPAYTSLLNTLGTGTPTPTPTPTPTATPTPTPTATPTPTPTPVPTPTPPGMPGGCTVAYRVTNQWPGAFQGAIAVTNNGAPVTSWTLLFTFPTTAQRITQLWNGNITQTGANVTVTNAPYNGSLGTGATVNPGFLANWSGTNPAPTAFRLNGVLCTVR